jgi:hypothetical protein
MVIDDTWKRYEKYYFLNFTLPGSIEGITPSWWIFEFIYKREQQFRKKLFGE